MSEEPFVLKYNWRHKILAIVYYFMIGIAAFFGGSYMLFSIAIVERIGMI